MGALFAAGVTLGLLTVLYDRRRRQGWSVLLTRHGAAALITAGATALLVGGLLSSWSRGAWLGFAAGAAVMLFFWPRRRWQGILLAAGSVAALGVAWQLGLIPAALADRLVGWTADLGMGDVRGVDITDANFAIVERLAHWQAAVGMAREQIWLGVGFGNYEAVYPEHALLNWPNALGHAHNYYLNLLAEVGFVGLLAYLLFWGAVLLQTLRMVSRRSWPWRGVALGLLGVWIALAIHHMLDKLYVNNLYLYLGVLLGLLQLGALSTAFTDSPSQMELAESGDT
jgi:O-antigen ligase